MKTFQYRWEIGGKEYSGAKDCKDETELQEHIKRSGGKLIEILNVKDKQEYPPAQHAMAQEVQEASRKERTDVAWEQKKEIGFVKTLFKTIVQLLFTPARFFRNLANASSYDESESHAIGFYFPTFIVATLVSVATNFIFLKFVMHASASMGKAGIFAMIVGLIVLPITCMLQLYIKAGVLHLFIRMFGGEDFSKTLSIMAYTEGVAKVFDIVPVAGPMIGSIWGVVIIITGIKPVHKFSTLKAIAVCIIPVIIVTALQLALPKSYSKHLV